MVGRWKFPLNNNCFTFWISISPRNQSTLVDQQPFPKFSSYNLPKKINQLHFWVVRFFGLPRLFQPFFLSLKLLHQQHGTTLAFACEGSIRSRRRSWWNDILPFIGGQYVFFCMQMNYTLWDVQYAILPRKIIYINILSLYLLSYIQFSDVQQKSPIWQCFNCFSVPGPEDLLLGEGASGGSGGFAHWVQCHWSSCFFFGCIWLRFLGIFPGQKKPIPQLDRPSKAPQFDTRLLLCLSVSCLSLGLMMALRRLGDTEPGPLWIEEQRPNTTWRRPNLCVTWMQWTGIEVKKGKLLVKKWIQKTIVLVHAFFQPESRTLSRKTHAMPNFEYTKSMKKNPTQ